MNSMFEIYEKNNTNYDSNGDITLTPTLCEYDSRERLITLEHPLDDLGRYKYICNDNVISIYDPDTKKKQFYRIYEINKTLYDVTAYARPLFYDLVDSIILDKRPTNKSGQEVLDILLEGTPFRGHSNIKTLNTSYYIRKNIVEALIGDDENSFVNRWGGELFLDNWDIYLNYKNGSDNGVRVEFGYNLESIEEVINFEEIVTRIIPLGYDGLMLEGDKPWVDSPNINKYVNIKTRVIEFSDVKVGTEEGEFATEKEARAELIKRAKELFDNGIDMPSATFTVNMINLRDTTEYEDFKILEDVKEGDTVHIYVKKLDINFSTRVTKINEDKITRRSNSIELGSVVKNFFENQADISNRVNNILNSNGTVKAQSLEGTIDSLNTKFKAQRSIAQKQEIRAMLFEDSVEGSQTYGAMCLGTMGFMIADKKTPDGSDWDWRTFGTGKGFTADEIVAGVLRAITLMSLDGSCVINLKDGNVEISKGRIGNDKTYMDLTKGLFYSTDYGSYGMEIGKGRINTDSGILIQKFDGREIDEGFGDAFFHLGHTVRPSDGIEGSSASIYADHISIGTPRVSPFEYPFTCSPNAWFLRNVKIDGNLEISGDLTINGIKINPTQGGGTGGVGGGSAMQQAVVNSARKLIGIPYVYGGNYPPLGSDNGTDCSGLMQWAYNDNGISISRTTYTQINDGVEVTESELQIGDLVFPRGNGDNGHVFMYSGELNGQHMCVEAPYTGATICERAFTWDSNYRARRIITS